MTIQGNKPLRFFAAAIFTLTVVAHLLGQVNLLEAWIFWPVLLMSVNAFQASFTGFCPMFKNAKGECIGCGTTCGTSSCAPAAAETAAQAAAEGCCSGETKTACCDESSKGCCDESAKGCCDSETPKTGCCSAEVLEVKVLGTGCANCENTAKLIQKTADEMGVAIALVKVEGVADIASYGVMSTPAVVIGDQVVHSGGIPAKPLVQTWLQPKSCC